MRTSIRNSGAVGLLMLSGALAFSEDSFAGNRDLEKLLKSFESKGTRVSAEIVNLTNSRTLLSVNPEMPLNPASSIKLFTAYTALERLGIDYSFKTQVSILPDRSLCVKGGGDPSFVMEDLYLLVQGMKRKGLESYSGRIVLDPSVFDEELYPEDRSDQDSERAYNAPISGLNFNYNTITVFANPTSKGKPARLGLDFPFDFVKLEGKVTTAQNTDVTWDKKGKGDLEVVTVGGRIAEGAEEWHKPFRIRNPSQAFGEAFGKMLAQSGIQAEGKLIHARGTCPSTDKAFFEFGSIPLSFTVVLMDKYSNNFIADSLVKAIDHEVNRRSGTAEGGISFIKTELQKIGIDLSAKGRTLKRVHKEKKILPELFSSLPIAGLDGTLKRKYRETRVQELLRGKTGTLNGVQSLVGIYPNEEGEWIGIAVIVNGGRGIPESELASFLAGH